MQFASSSDNYIQDMQQFEYLAVYVNSQGCYQADNGSWKEINELGQLGWELVSVVNESAELVAFFKRCQAAAN